MRTVTQKPLKSVKGAPRWVLFLTLVEQWVFARLGELAREAVSDHTLRIGVPKNGDDLLERFALQPSDVTSEALREILGRLERAGIIEPVGRSGKSKEHMAYRLARRLDDFRVVEIERRPKFSSPKAHVAVINRIMACEGPDPNLGETFKPVFAAWLEEIGFKPGSPLTILYKVKGYMPKPEDCGRRGLASRWGIWYKDEETGRWLLSVPGFLSIELMPTETKPIVRKRAKKAGHSAELAKPAEPEPPLAKELSPIEKLNAELLVLEERAQRSEAAMEEVERLERELVDARNGARDVELSDAERARLGNLRIAKSVLESL